jgi:hypothetical protein
MTPSQCCSNVASKLGPLTYVPSAGLAALYAAEIRQATGQPDGPADLQLCADAIDGTIELRSLGAERGGCQGLLAPLEGDRFRITVDPTPAGGWGSATPDQRATISRRRSRFLIGHELGHTLFYRRRERRRPARSIPTGHPLEEQFCDRFARSLLVPPAGRARSASEILAASERFDVSLQVATRAAAETGIRATLWRWEERPAKFRAVLDTQWASEHNLGRKFGINDFRTDPKALPELLAVAAAATPGLTWMVLPDRRQALAVCG